MIHMVSFWFKLLKLIALNKQLFINKKTSKILYFDDEINYENIENLFK